MDFGAMMKLKKGWDTFTSNHPKFPGFLTALKSRGIHEGDIVLISITGPDGKVMETNLRITQSDLELVDLLESIKH